MVKGRTHSSTVLSKQPEESASMLKKILDLAGLKKIKKKKKERKKEKKDILTKA